MEKEIFAKRINNMPTSIFSIMSKMAVEYKAVNLGQGFPDFDGPVWIMEEAFEAMKHGKNQYAPSHGIQSLRSAVKSVQKEYYGLDWNCDSEITITAGATEALYSTITALVDPGDEAVMFEPFYDSYQADVMLAGGIPKYVTLKKPDFRFDFDEFEQAVSPKTKLIILNTPHNPVGKVFSREELEFIAGIAKERGIIVISDEVYEFITYNGRAHIPIASLPGMKDLTVTISSTGKTFSMTGWKIGFAIASEKLTDAIRKVHQWTTYAVNTPAQHAMAHALGRLGEYLPQFRREYEEKRNLIYKELLLTNFKPHQVFGSYFMLADIPGGVFENSYSASIELVKKYGIAAIPCSVFYSKSDEGESMLRFCFAKNEATILSGIEKLRNVPSPTI